MTEIKKSALAKTGKTEVQKSYRKLSAYIGDWGAGKNKEALLGNIHRNLIGLNKQGIIRPIEDLAYFLLICDQYKLNPLKKEIYPVYQSVKIGDVWQEKLEPIVSIHGLRSLARRASRPTYAYTGKAVYGYKENTKDLDSATVEVYGYFEDKNIIKVGEYTAFMEEFQRTKKDGSPTKQWATMPRVMLAKCAEANAIRSTFDLGGVHIAEEMPAVEDEN